MPFIEPATLPQRPPPATAAKPASVDWQPAATEHSLTGDTSGGKTYFRDLHTTREGTFAVMYESFLDQRNTVTGTFRVAQFRYVYPAPIEAGGAAHPEHDESITTVLLDCAQHLAGDTSTEYLLRGSSLGATVRADRDVLMIQMTLPSTVTELCRFLER